MTQQENDIYYRMLVRTIVALLSEGMQIDESKIIDALRAAQSIIQLRTDFEKTKKQEIY